MSALEGAMDVDQIMRAIPHRPPFLFIDRVWEHVPGTFIRGEKVVGPSKSDRALQSPLVVIESIAQLAVILASESMAAEREGGDLFFFAGIQHADIRGAANVGDRIALKARVERVRRGVGWYQGSASVNDECIVDVTMQAVFKPGAASAARSDGDRA